MFFWFHILPAAQQHADFLYILLTVYAFLFVLLCDIIKKISCFSFPGNKTQLALIITYSIFLTLDIILYIFTLIKLIHLLKGVAIERFNPQVVLKRDMVNADSKAVAKYICSRYNQCIDTNNTILEKRYQQFNACANYMIPIIIFSFFLIIISNFIV